MNPGPHYRFRFFFDPGSGTCLWSDSEEARRRYDYAVDLKSLPLSENTYRALLHLVLWFDSSLDWDDPSGPGPWTEEEKARFRAATVQILADVRRELGNGYSIADESSI